MNFNIRLKQLRQIKRITQGDLATVIGVKASTIANYESNRNEPSFHKLIALANYFNVSVDYLLGVTEECHSCVIKTLDNKNYELYQLFRKLKAQDIEELKDYIKYLSYKQSIK